MNNESYDFGQLLMPSAEKVVEQSKLVEQFEGGGMNHMAPKIAQKIGMLFDPGRLDARTSPQKTPAIMPAGPARNPAIDFHGFRSRVLLHRHRVLPHGHQQS